MPQKGIHADSWGCCERDHRLGQEGKISRTWHRPHERHDVLQSARAQKGNSRRTRQAPLPHRHPRDWPRIVMRYSNARTTYTCTSSATMGRSMPFDWRTWQRSTLAPHNHPSVIPIVSPMLSKNLIIRNPTGTTNTILMYFQTHLIIKSRKKNC